jgi:hypothetical protein
MHKSQLRSLLRQALSGKKYSPRLTKRSRLNVQSLELRCTPTATISGTVFNDLNSNGVQDVGESGVAGVTVFLSLNKSGVFATGDPTATTNAIGKYTFSGVATNRDYVVAVATPSGYKLTAPIYSLRPTLNVNTSKRADNQAETSVAIDPTNPNRVFVMSNDLSVAEGMIASYSIDGGATWVSRIIADGSDGLPLSGGDPGAVFDKFGNLWISSLDDSNNGVTIARSTDGGKSFTPFTTILPGAGVDQPTIVTGPSSTPGRALLAVTVHNNFGQYVSYLEVNGSGPIGAFSTPTLVPNSDNGIGGNFGDIVIGPGGKVADIYQNAGSGAGPDNIYFNLDPDGIGPQSFGPRSIATPTNVGAFFYPPAQPDRGVDAESDLEWDTSGGPHNGRLYLLYCDSPAVGSFDMNIFVRFSDNNGTTWSSPVRVNDDSGASTQMLPRMSLDPTTGNLAVTWYDCREDPANSSTEFWGTVSTDGGKTFLPNIKLSAGQSTSGGAFSGGFDYGDYSGIDFFNGRFIGGWADNSNSTGDNPDGALTFKDIYVGKVSVATNVNNFYISAVNGQTYSSLNFGLHFSGEFQVNLTGGVQNVQITGVAGLTNRLTINGTPISDTFTIQPGVVTTRAGAVISFSGIQELVVNGLNGGDNFFAQGISIPVFLNGNNPNFAPGDRLAVTTTDAIQTPTSSRDGTFTFPSGGQTLTYTGMELAEVAQDLPPVATPHSSFAVGAGAGGLPIATFYRDGKDSVTYQVMAFDPSFRGGVRVSCGDVDGDGVPDLIVAAGPGGGPHVQVFSGRTSLLIDGPTSSFFAYDAGFSGGVYVASGDVNGDGKADIITGAGEGGGPHVRVFDGATRQIIREFFAFDPSFRGGVRVAAADVNGDGKADIICAAGPGGGPHVRVFDGATGQLIREFFAFDASFHGGVFVSAGDVTGDGKADIVTGAGDGGGPTVSIWDGATGALVSRFNAYPPNQQGTGLLTGDNAWASGVRVAFADTDGDGISELYVAPGRGKAGPLKGFAFNPFSEIWSQPAADPTFLGGMYVGS